MARMAWGAGLTTEAADGTTLDVWYRWFGWGEFGDDEMIKAYPDLDVQLGMLRGDQTIDLPVADLFNVTGSGVQV